MEYDSDDKSESLLIDIYTNKYNEENENKYIQDIEKKLSDNFFCLKLSIIISFSMGCLFLFFDALFINEYFNENNENIKESYIPTIQSLLLLGFFSLILSLCFYCILKNNN